MNSQELDVILYNQLIVARLGEKELMNWWNTDISYELGGFAFLKDLLGETMAPLAAAEAILEAAKLKEQALLKDIPASTNPISLFVPESQVQVLLSERMRHFKRYPEDVPENISNIMNSKTDFSIQDLKGLIVNSIIADFSETSFGKMLLNVDSISAKERSLILAEGAADNDKNQYTLNYYSGANNAT